MGKTRQGHPLLTVLFTLLRIMIGWHFLYEGMAKLWIPGWTSASYLEMSRWIFAPFFHWIASHPLMLRGIDLLNIWGLILIGLALILGLWIRIASLFGVGLVGMYYLAHPPLVGLGFGVPVEGHYLIVDKNLVELATLLLFVFLRSDRTWGIDQLLILFKTRRNLGSGGDTTKEELNANRRAILKNLVSLPILGLYAVAFDRKRAWHSLEEKHLLDVVTSASVKIFQFTGIEALRGRVPRARIGNLELSRLILGGNLIGGWAHARDLLYVSKLVKAYHHRDKVFETLYLAEKCGINALLTNPLLAGVVQEYWRRRIGKIRFISDCGGEDLLERIRISIDAGASACYVQGEVADRLVREKQFDMIDKALRLIRDNGLPAGIGGHSLATIQGCVNAGLAPDFWMKTLHHRNYWSANFSPEHDNVFCRAPKETIAFMQGLKEPWIAFKVLAAGAIPPEEGFRYAFENGADFICVGMYDFQIVEDVNILLSVLKGELHRMRPWRA